MSTEQEHLIAVVEIEHEMYRKRVVPGSYQKNYFPEIWEDDLPDRDFIHTSEWGTQYEKEEKKKYKGRKGRHLLKMQR